MFLDAPPAQVAQIRQKAGFALARFEASPPNPALIEVLTGNRVGALGGLGGLDTPAFFGPPGGPPKIVRSTR
jgi:hypothetical protein